MAENNPTRRSHNFQDLSGQTFGSWTVTGLDGLRGKETYFLCRCVCGTSKPVNATALRSGRSQSCGKGRCSHRWKHGGSRNGAAEYKIWLAIKTRCCYGNNPRIRKNYRDRGITVCKGWQESFSNFIEVMGPRPSPNHSVDRIDNESGYTCGRCADCTANGCPLNCRWATRSEQAHNTRNNHWITHQGRKQTITDWCRETGLDVSTVLYRLRAGWPLAEVFAPHGHGHVRRRKARI